MQRLREWITTAWDLLGVLNELRGRGEVAVVIGISVIGVAVAVVGLVINVLGPAGAGLFVLGVSLLCSAGVLLWWRTKDAKLAVVPSSARSAGQSRQRQPRPRTPQSAEVPSAALPVAAAVPVRKPPKGAPWRGPSLYRSGVRIEGQPNYHCPYCPFSSVDGPEAIDDHTAKEHRVDHASVNDHYDDPQPWADIPIHYVGDHSEWFPGLPADERRTLYVAERRADEVARLYPRGISPHMIRHGANAFGYTDRFGRAVEVHADKDGLLVPRTGSEASALAGHGLLRLPVAIELDLRWAIADVHQWMTAAAPDPEELPKGATAAEMRRHAERGESLRNGYQERYAARVAGLVAELKTSGLPPDDNWDALADGVTLTSLQRLIAALERAADALASQSSSAAISSQDQT